MSILEQLKEPALAVLGVVLIVAAVIGVGLIAERLGCTGYKECKYAIELAIDEKILTIKE